jgi:outer membrane lipoprotein-sorting protein
MKKFFKNLSMVLLVVALTISCVSVVYSQESSEKAKEILENTYKKYIELTSKEGKDLKSVIAKVAIKGAGNVPAGEGESMPMNVDVKIEMYMSKPRNFFFSIAGNVGNAIIAVTGEEKAAATIMLPTTKQFAVIDMPEDFMQEVESEDPEKPSKLEEFSDDAILTYEGMGDTKLGRAHKIGIRPKDPTEKTSIMVYILDRKWDPARIEVREEEEGGQLTVDFEELKLNERISDDKFKPDTAGYTQITKDQLTAVIMMQVMAAMMQGEQ